MSVQYFILDSRSDSREVYQKLFSLLDFPSKLVGISSDLKTASEQISRLNPNLILLSPDLDGEDGFQILSLNEQLSQKTIVVSETKEHAVRAFSFCVAHFLLRPFNLEDWERGLRKVFGPLLTIKKQEPIHSLPAGKKRFEWQQIVRLQSFRNYTHIYFQSGETDLDCHNLGYFEKILRPQGFIRIHHSHIVAIEHVNSFHYKSSKIILRDGTEVPVSRERKKRFLDLFDPEK